MVTIRFTILFLRVSIWFGSLKCKQKLSINCQLDQLLQARRILLIQINLGWLYSLHEYFRQVFNFYQQNVLIAKNLGISFRNFQKTLNYSANKHYYE